MALKKEFLPLELIELVNISMKTQHTIQSGILMATVIDYLALIDKHKHSDTCAESIVGKKELTKFVDC